MKIHAFFRPAHPELVDGRAGNLQRAAGFGVARRCIALATLVLALLLPHGAAAFSTAQEAELGRKFELEARAKLPLVDDIEVVGFVEEIGRKLVATLGEQPFAYEFFVVRDGNVNAFAVPGGYIYLHTGLLTQVENIDEIAGVLGHEVAHVHAHHLARQQEATRFLNYTTLLGMLLSVVQPAIGAGALAVQAAVQLEYRREFEREADYLGARFMKAAGYEPIGMLDFFKRLNARQAAVLASGLPPYLMTHPLSAERLTNLEAVLRQRQWDQRPRRDAGLELRRVQLLAALASSQPELIIQEQRKRADAAPSDPQAHYLLGLALLSVGRFDTAAESLEKARDLGMPAIDRELGRVRFGQKRFPEAVDLLRAAVALAPDDPVAHHALGRALEASQQSTAARAAFERALVLAPRMQQAHRDLGMLAGRHGEEGLGFYHLGMSLVLRGDYPSAVRQFEQATKALPADSPLRQRIRAEFETLGHEPRS